MNASDNKVKTIFRTKTNYTIPLIMGRIKNKRVHKSCHLDQNKKPHADDWIKTWNKCVTIIGVNLRLNQGFYKMLLHYVIHFWFDPAIVKGQVF